MTRITRSPSHARVIAVTDAEGDTAYYVADGSDSLDAKNIKYQYWILLSRRENWSEIIMKHTSDPKFVYNYKHTIKSPKLSPRD